MDLELTSRPPPPGGASVTDYLTLFRYGLGTVTPYQVTVPSLIASIAAIVPAPVGTPGPAGPQGVPGPQGPASALSATSPIVLSSGVVSLQQGGATTGQALVWNGSAWAPGTVSGGGTSYVLPAATASTLGGVKQGSGVTIAGDGTLTVTATTYTLPAATGSALGGVKVGAGLAVTSDGTLSATGGTTTPIVVKTIDGTTTVASTSAPYQMVATDRLIDVVNASGAPIKLLLPTSPTVAVEYTIIDGSRTAGTNSITVAGGNGVTINGAATFVMNANSDALTLRAVSATTWRIT